MSHVDGSSQVRKVSHLSVVVVSHLLINSSRCAFNFLASLLSRELRRLLDLLVGVLDTAKKFYDPCVLSFDCLHDLEFSLADESVGILICITLAFDEVYCTLFLVDTSRDCLALHHLS